MRYFLNFIIDVLASSDVENTNFIQLVLKITFFQINNRLHILTIPNRPKIHPLHSWKNSEKINK